MALYWCLVVAIRRGSTLLKSRISKAPRMNSAQRAINCLSSKKMPLFALTQLLAACFTNDDGIVWILLV